MMEKKNRGSASRPQNISRRLGTTRNLFACCEKIIRGIFRSKTEQRGLFATRCKRNGLIYIQRIENLGIDTQQTYKREKYTWELSLRDEWEILNKVKFTIHTPRRIRLKISKAKRCQKMKLFKIFSKIFPKDFLSNWPQFPNPTIIFLST